MGAVMQVLPWGAAQSNPAPFQLSCLNTEHFKHPCCTHKLKEQHLRLLLSQVHPEVAEFDMIWPQTSSAQSSPTLCYLGSMLVQSFCVLD